MIRWLLSKLSPVPTHDMARVRHSCPDDPSKRRVTHKGDPWRHRIRRPELVQRKRGIA